MKGTGNKGIAAAVRELIAPVAEQMGYYLWDVEYVKEGADRYLRITIDNEDGISIDDCEKLHRAIDPLLDEADPIEESYILEVSSPGIERELKCDEHIHACEGWDIEIKLYAPINGTKQMRGVLRGLDESGECVVAECGGETVCIKKSDIAKLSTYYNFD